MLGATALSAAACSGEIEAHCDGEGCRSALDRSESQAPECGEGDETCVRRATTCPGCDEPCAGDAGECPPDSPDASRLAPIGRDSGAGGCSTDSPDDECLDTPDPVNPDPARCGDGDVGPDEECDDGDNDGSYGGCMSDCQHRAPYCGDGDVDPVEVCDDGVNDGSAGGCSSDCLARTTDCGTPFLLWPAICREDLPDVMSDYEEPTLPTSSGTEVEATTIAGINAALPGSEITITADMHEWTFLSGEDKDLIIADGVTVDALVIDTCMRCRARGGGPNARIKYLYVHNAQDVTVDSVLIKADSAYSERAVEIQMSDRIALISTVFHSPYSAAMFTSHVNGLLIAGSSWASSDAGGVNDWGSRFADTSDVVIVDSQIEARGMQPVLRRGGGFSMRHFYLRTTTVNLDSAESTLDLGGETQDGFDQMYQQSPTYYISNLSAGPLLRYGGSPNDDAGMGLYEVTDATWHTPPSGDSAYMGEADLASRESSVWKYRLGTPTFDATLSGTYEERHPGWPARGSRTLGVPLSESNPFDL